MRYVSGKVGELVIYTPIYRLSQFCNNTEIAIRFFGVYFIYLSFSFHLKKSVSEPYRSWGLVRRKWNNFSAPTEEDNDQVDKEANASWKAKQEQDDGVMS